MVTTQSTCLTCGGTIINEYGDPVCLNCGRTPGQQVLEQRPMAQSHRPLSAWDCQKEAMMADYANGTTEHLFTKYHLNSSTWLALKMRWDVPGRKSGVKARG